LPYNSKKLLQELSINLEMKKSSCGTIRHPPPNLFFSTRIKI